MANRRMFSLDVIDTDKFLDMPLTAQCLYFHLGMRADDDGFIDSPKRILRYIGSNDDDLKLLLSKGYLIPFSSGVIVISDWKKNNYIQSDRRKHTVYTEELSCLHEYNGTYSMCPECIHDVYKVGMNTKQDISKTDTRNKTGENPPKIGSIHDVSKTDTQDRLGKDSIGYNITISKDIVSQLQNIPDENQLKENEVRLPYQEIVDMYNGICISFPRLTKLSEARKKAIRARLKQYSIEDFKRLFEVAEGSSFLKGENNRDWSATFDWLIKDANMAKVLDGNYSDKGGQAGNGQQPKKPYQQFEQREYSREQMDELERKLLGR